MRFLAAMVVLSMIAASTAGAHDALEVKGSSVHARTGPGLGHRVLGHVHDGEVYAITGRQGEWYRFQHTNGDAWAHERLVRPVPAPILEVIGAHANVRAGPGSRFRDVGDLSMGARVAVRATRGEWRQLCYGGRAAWVHASLLGPVGTIASGGRPRSAAGFIQLPASGTGFYSYAAPDRRWGTPSLVYGLERIARRWARQHPDAPPMGVGDLSLEDGGDISGHGSHEEGRDVDVRLMPRGPDRIVVNRFSARYSRIRTRSLIRMFHDELSTDVIFFNDRQVPGTRRWPRHDDHFHVRVHP